MPSLLDLLLLLVFLLELVGALDLHRFLIGLQLGEQVQGNVLLLDDDAIAAELAGEGVQLPLLAFEAQRVLLVARLLLLVFLLLDQPLGAAHPLRHVVLKLLQILV